MRILLTHTPSFRANYYGDEAVARLRALGDVVLYDSETPLDPAALISAAKGIDVIVSDRQTAAPAEVFERLPDLVAYVRCAMDIRNIDVDAASIAGVLVTRATAGFVDSVVELGIGLMVDLARGVSAATTAYRAGKMPVVRMGRQLAGSTLGIVGLGAIGRRLAEAAAALRMNVIFSDPETKSPPPGAMQAPFADVLAKSNFVVCLVPATEATRHLFDAAAFARMGKGAYFVNLARGELVDEAALEEALDRGHLAGAAMDVGMAPDQMPMMRLAARADVVATPHIGGLTPQAIAHQAFDTVRQVEALASGKMPDLAVNPARATRLAKFGIAVPSRV